MDQSNPLHELIRLVRLLLASVAGLVIVVIGLCCYIVCYTKPVPSTKPDPGEPPVVTTDTKDTVSYWTAPDTTSLAPANRKLILYGRDLIAHTAVYFGAKGTVKAQAINGMNCQNCHLDAGTRIFGNNYGAVSATYPKYRARSGAIENIYKRVNDCFERSLNGQALDTTSAEMQAIVAYIHWLGTGVPKGEKVAGSGFKDLAFLDRPCDPEKGRLVYQQQCQSCHQANGAGTLNAAQTEYQYPPLWGAHSYNDGAGLYRISNCAKYIKYNMPYGVHYTDPRLTDAEAWDVAAYINTQPRPHKDCPADWPKLVEKPYDHPFGPYADGYPARQHKYGPYAPIKKALDSLKKKPSIS